MSRFASWLASPPPDAAVEIGPESVSVAVVGTHGSAPVVEGYAVEPLAPGAVVPSLTSQNLADRRAVVGALRDALERLGGRPRRVALVVPDVVARVALVRFDKVPARREDLTQLIRWQVRKSAPFPVDDACLSYQPGSRPGAEGEFLVVLARRSIVREYESVCEELGMQAGIVDLATSSVINLCLSRGPALDGDWLVVHMRPEYTSLAIVRGADVIFFRSRPEGDEESLTHVVHQTTMYYQDRLAGEGFVRVLLGGAGRTPSAIDIAKLNLEERLRLPVESIDPARVAPLKDQTNPAPELKAVMSPLVGILLRAREEAVAA
jgi:type IV pilus assembly protein PilM